MRVAILAALVAAAAAAPGLVGHGAGLVGHGVVGHGAVGGLGLGYVGAVKPVAAVRPVPIVHGVHKGYAATDYAEPRPYHYQYAVDDPHYGPMFAKQEEADGAGNVVGSYATNLPDGRTQIVKYVADHYNGFNAEVSYEGYAQHPQVARGYGGYGGVGHGVAGGAVLGLGHGAVHGVAHVVKPVIKAAPLYH